MKIKEIEEEQNYREIMYGFEEPIAGKIEDQDAMMKINEEAEKEERK